MWEKGKAGISRDLHLQSSFLRVNQDHSKEIWNFRNLPFGLDRVWFSCRICVYPIK